MWTRRQSNSNCPRILKFWIHFQGVFVSLCLQTCLLQFLKSINCVFDWWSTEYLARYEIKIALLTLFRLTGSDVQYFTFSRVRENKAFRSKSWLEKSSFAWCTCKPRFASAVYSFKGWNNLANYQKNIQFWIHLKLKIWILSSKAPELTGRSSFWNSQKKNFFFFDRASRNIRVMKTNLMHYLSSVYFVHQPLHVSGIFVAHNQEVYCIYI